MERKISNPKAYAATITWPRVLNDRLARKVTRIADAIVDLVERTGGPVLLHELDQKVPGFKASGRWSYNYFITNNGKEIVYWQGMTEAGLEALRSVLSSRRVAVQYVSRLLYLLDSVEVDAGAWEPIALLPVRAANIDTRKWAVRASQASRAKALSMAPSDFRPLTPQAVRSTADDFCTW
ncbi:hypothetical protein [Bradyrhizobium sp. CCBAU 51753]|uniref:hypothetical protein n=1 Tax=Bradyrhizobium sp. CCBAU 51753 TaxID=1325100 RepID=UPI00188CE122|nr:hypothetical protein [Bradyrhizobium sp. CCBAU 51753]QOZ23133.1 hypothetical protein XH93_05265 [Bradyrhizobium sp. CCBAU 51753]